MPVSPVGVGRVKKVMASSCYYLLGLSLALSFSILSIQDYVQFSVFLAPLFLSGTCHKIQEH